MKLKSLVIVNYYVTVNVMSNFAHTAHHARKVITVGKFNYFFLIYIFYVKKLLVDNVDGYLSEVDTRYW